MESFSLSIFDLMLLGFCPLGGVIGSFAYAIMDSIDPTNSPKNENDAKVASLSLQEKRGIWLGLRCILGMIVGLLISLYFLGSIQENISTVSKIIALSIIAGYAAPKIWTAQDRVIEEKLKNISFEK